MSGNTCAGKPADIGEAQDIEIDNVVHGADNLIGRVSLPVSVSATDTVWSNNPRLAPLAANDGRTPTRALLSDSSAIDNGNNLPRFQYDQRGEGFPRIVDGKADIGAFERQD